MLLRAMNIKKDYGGTVVLDGAELSVAEGDKVALVGRNGTGKTTLLNIVCGRDDDFSGQCLLQNGRRVALVDQYAPDYPGTALEFLTEDVRTLRSELRNVEEALADANAISASVDSVLTAYGRLRERYDALSGDEAEERGVRFLASIGLPGIADRPLAVLSGGEKNILALGRALNAKPDLLVLDEPGNHLDIWGLAWLERFLASIPQSVLIVSHNRYLLDRVATRVVELENGKTTEYSGGWSAYRMEKLRKSAAQGLDWKADCRKLERLEALVKRFEQIARSRPDPAWGKRLRARRSQLERAKADATDKPVDEAAGIALSFASEISKADIAIVVDGYSKSFPGRELFRDAKLLIRTGERVALVGPNGSGKSTFLSDLVHHGRWDDPVLRIGPSLKLGWCAQQQEVFDNARTIREEFLRLGTFTEDAIFNALKRFLFGRADLDKRIGELSGGERNRLQLARTVLLGADLLILDEPTNHLDIRAREAVEEALADFKGTILVVSHDRFFLDRVVDRVVEIDGEGGFISWPGNFSEFWYRAYGPSGSTSVSRQTPDRQPKRPERQASRQASRQAGRAENRGQSVAAAKRERPDSGEAENRIMRMENERVELERRSAQALARGDYREARRLGNELVELSRHIEEAVSTWTD